ncbi:MAG: hypothetical protein JXQ75_14965 [Phycisphaerae bacterium]|nr:hypothetical protein [Phycisphaerae bacterium]
MAWYKGVFLSVVLGCVAPVLADATTNDYLVISRSYGTVYTIDRTTGWIRRLVSGLELRDQSGVVRGNGLPLDGSFRSSLATSADCPILARFGQSAPSYGLACIDPMSGDRVLLPGSDSPLWDELGHLILSADGTIISTADNWSAGADSDGMILRYAQSDGTTTVITGGGVGDGPVLKLPRALAQLDENTLLVVEWKWNNAPPSAGAGLYTVDLWTGDRTFLSRLVCDPFERPLVVGGQPAGTVMLGDDEGGDGPVSNLQARSVAVIDGRIFVGQAIGLVDGSYNGGILEVDPVTGDRTLLVGKALEDDGTCQTVATALPSGWTDVFLDAPMGLMESDNGRLAFVCLFGPDSVFEYDLATNELFEIADLDAQLDPAFIADVEFSGLTLLPIEQGDCNGNGIPDECDIDCGPPNGPCDAPGCGHSSDCNWNGVPDECESISRECPYQVGDVNNDGEVNRRDLIRFILVLVGLDHLECHVAAADINGDGAVDCQDICPFIQLLRCNLCLHRVDQHGIGSIRDLMSLAEEVGVELDARSALKDLMKRNLTPRQQQVPAMKQ